MSFLLWSALAFALSGICIFVFIVIAKKGRELRKLQPLPPPATNAFLQNGQGEVVSIDTSGSFYLGSDPKCEIVLPKAKRPFEVCIFYHRSRFALQAPEAMGEIRVNGEDRIAGYLWDSDVIEIAGERFVFRCS